MSVQNLSNVLSKLSSIKIKKINLLGIQALSKEYYKDFSKILENFKGLPLNIILNYNSLCPNNKFLLKESHLRITLIIDNSSINGDLEKDSYLLTGNTRFLFPVSNKNDYDNIMNFVNRHNIIDYKIIPALNSHNKKIITKLIYIRKKEITNSIDKKTIELNKLLNCNFWGKFIILPNGEVLPNFYSKIRGNIFKDSFIDLIDKEISLNDSFWLKTRDNKICNKCIFQHLCPPPSNYELFLNNPTICFKYI
jgi:pseudo-rSAM protein